MGEISLISRDGQFVNGFGVRSGGCSASERLGEPWVWSLESEGGVLGDANRFGVTSQSIRLGMVNYM